MNATPGFTTSDLLTLVAMISTATLIVGKILLSIRDTLRDLKSAIGGVDPPTGLIGEIAEVKADQAKTNAKVEEHHELILEAGLRQERRTSGIDDRRQRERDSRERHLSIRKQGL